MLQLFSESPNLLDSVKVLLYLGKTPMSLYYAFNCTLYTLIGNGTGTNRLHTHFPILSPGPGPIPVPSPVQCV